MNYKDIWNKVKDLQQRWNHEADYYVKGLKYLPQVDTDKWKEGIHDAAIAAPRGLMRGGNLVAQTVAGEWKGLNDVGINVANKGIRAVLPRSVAPAVSRVVTAPLRAENKVFSTVQDASNKATNAFLDYYRYRDPSNLGARVAEAASTAIPAAYVIGKTGLSQASRAFAPIQASDATAAARMLPGLGSSKALATVHNMAKLPAFNLTTNAIASGFPVVDYAFGFTHQNPDDSKLTRGFKSVLKQLPNTAALMNPLAAANAKLNSSPERVIPRMEYFGRGVADVGALFANREKGLAKQLQPHAEQWLKDWWNYQPNIESYRNYADKSFEDFWEHGWNVAKERQPERQAKLLDDLKHGYSEDALRWVGIQPSAHLYNKGAYTPAERMQLLQAFGKGVTTATKSEDNWEAIAGKYPVEFHNAAKSVWDQAKQYNNVGNLEDATAIVIQNIPDLAQRFLKIVNNQ